MTTAKEYNRQYYERNAQRLRERANTYYQENRDVVLKRNRAYVQNNGEKVKANRKRYWHETRKQKEKVDWHTPEGRAAKLLRTARAMAPRRGLAFEIGIDNILPAMLAGKCQVTGIPFDMLSARGPFRPSIDRIDSSRGYEIDNVQLVVWSDVVFMARNLLQAQGAAS